MLFPHVQQQLTNKIQEEHQQPITGRANQIKALEFTNEKHQQKILRLITGRDNQIKALEFTNEKHQQKILRLNKEIDDLIKNRHVPRSGYFDNVLCFIKKNSKGGYPNYIIRCQYKQLEKYKKCLKLCYPDMEVADECDDPNAIH